MFKKISKITFFSAVCAAALFSACSSDDDVVEKSEPQALRLTATLDEQESRAATNLQSTQFVSGRPLTVFTFTGTKSSTVFQNNQVGMKADGSGNIVDYNTLVQNIYYAPSQVVNVWVISPHFQPSSRPFSDTEEKTYDWEVKTDQSTGEYNYCVSDLCSGYLYGVQADGKSHIVPMKHLYSKVTVNILPGDDGYTLAESDISSIVVNAKTSGTMTFSKLQSPTGTDPIKSVVESTTATKKNITVGKGTLSCSAILPPQAIASGSALVKVTLTNGVVWTYTLASQLKLESGKAYQLDLKPNRPVVGQETDGTQDLKVNIVNWTSVSKSYDYQLNH